MHGFDTWSKSIIFMVKTFAVYSIEDTSLCDFYVMTLRLTEHALQTWTSRVFFLVVHCKQLRFNQTSSGKISDTLLVPLLLKGRIQSEKYWRHFHCQTDMLFHYLKLCHLNFPARVISTQLTFSGGMQSSKVVFVIRTEHKRQNGSMDLADWCQERVFKYIT